jgi:hypothetical protein
VLGRDRARQAHAYPDHAIAVGARLGQRGVDHLRGGVEPLDRQMVHIDRLPALGEDGVREVADRDGDVAVAEVDADDRARGRRQRDQHGWAAYLRALLLVGLALDDQAGSLEVCDEARHGRPGQTGDSRDLCATGDAAAPEHLDHQAPVGVAQRLQSSCGGALHPSTRTI